MSTRWEVERALLASDLPPLQRLLVLTLLTLSDPKTCVVPAQFTPSLTRLAELTGMARSTVATNLTGAESAGWVIRRPPPKAVAWAEKARTLYRVVIPKGAKKTDPAGPIPPDPTSPGAGTGLVREPDPTSPADGPTSPGAGLGLVREPVRTSPGAGHRSDLLNQEQPRAAASTPEQIVSHTTGATPDEAAAIVSRIRNERQGVRNLPGLLRRMAADGDLTQLLTDQRAAARKTVIAEELALARQGPDCEHGTPGGTALHPASGKPLCPQCRVKAQRAAFTVITG